MKKIILIISILLFLGTNAFAKWKYNQGDIVQGEVIFGKKDTFKLPPGEFFVALVTREREFLIPKALPYLLDLLLNYRVRYPLPCRSLFSTDQKIIKALTKKIYTYSYIDDRFHFL